MHKTKSIIIITLILSFCCCVVTANTEADNRDLSLWYTKPADIWQTEALPIGNGRLGAMIFGGVAQEHIQFNEDTLWIGDEKDTGAYQAFGDIYIDMEHSRQKDYRRQLDIANAIHTITYSSDQVNYTRRYFSSNSANVIVLEFTADKKGAYTGTVSMTDMHKGKISAAENRITSSGSLAGYTFETTVKYDIALDYEAQLLILNKGGRITTQDNKIRFEKVDSFTILLTAGTDYLNQRNKGWKGKHPHKRLTTYLADASKKSFDELLNEHIRQHHQLFDRLTLNIGNTPTEISQLPTDQRLLAYMRGSRDPGLEVLLFQYARYLMISSSRPGTMPANLQGLWNNTNTPPWRSDYHTDVNVQMNYWFVDQANLSECFLPLAEWVNSIRQVRKNETKKAFNARGWVTHGENGIFGGSTWKWSKGDASWVAQNLWDHYAFTLDRQYLKERAYPVMKELCQFWQDNLKALPDGTLVSPDGYSPEHGPDAEDGVSFDQQLIWDLFTNTIEAATVLDTDKQYRLEITALRDKLLAPKIGKWGQLQEWMIDRDDPNDQHRHMSHMIAIHPGRQISPLTTPQLAQAAKVSMLARGDGGTGWSRAWKISIWARLHDGDHAYRILRGLLTVVDSTETNYSTTGGGIYPNLFDAHPPFQIDGNFGYAAGVCEMLVQSHMGQIHLLPALPAAWPNGFIKGVRARGGAQLDIAWKNGKLTNATLRADKDQQFKIRYNQTIRTVSLKKGQSITLGNLQ